MDHLVLVIDNQVAMRMDDHRLDDQRHDDDYDDEEDVSHVPAVDKSDL